MSDSTAALGQGRASYLDRVRTLPATELIGVMARREAGRLLFWERSRQGLVIGLLAACAAALLIPVHRAYGNAAQESMYLLLFCAAVQIALLALSAHAVWAGARHDAATGSLDEIVLTGAPPQALLLGKWVGASGAGVFWALMLAPALFLGGAFTGAAPGRLAAVLACWAVTPAVGAMGGALAVFTERGAGGTPIWMVFQAWFLLRMVGPRVASAAGPVAQELMFWVQRLDPLTMVPAALGRVREPWGLKVVFLALLLSVAVAWLAGAERSLPDGHSRASKREGDLLSLRPLRALAAGGNAEAEGYGRDAFFRFERNHGWRLRVTPPAWLMVLAFTLLPAVPASILGPEAPWVAAVLTGADVLLAGSVAALGMAASVASEREQGRWTFLLCAPLGAREILYAKWRAVCLETWPLWAAGSVRALLLAVGGALSWSALPAALLAAPAAAAAAAGVVAALSIASSSLAIAQQRALVWILAPPALALGARFLLPRLPGLEWISPAHGVAAVVDGRGSALLGLLPLLAQVLLGVAGLAWATRRLRAGDLG